MRRDLSLRASVVLLAVLCVIAAQAISFSALMAFPAAPPPSMTAASVAAAVHDPALARSAGLHLSASAAPPFEPGARPYTRLVAHTLQMLLSDAPVREVRVRSLSDAVSVRTNGAPPPTIALSQLGRFASVSDLATAPFPSFAVALRQKDGRWRLIEPIRPMISPEQLRIAAAFGLSLLVLTPLTWWSARRLTRPLQVLANASATLERDPGAPPLPVAGPREVQAAALAFNAMQAGLARQVEERSTLMAAIAHDLRTPLTSLRLRTEAVQDHLRVRMVADIGRMERLVADLLVYVRGARPSAARENFDLAKLTAEVATDAQARGWRVSFDQGSPSIARAEPASVRRILENLVENASIYAGAARITIGRDKGWVCVRIDDDGPGVPAEALEKVFQPFVRLELSRSQGTGGVGLGLAIARSIARANGGDVHLSLRNPTGLSARLRLPT